MHYCVRCVAIYTRIIRSHERNKIQQDNAWKVIPAVREIAIDIKTIGRRKATLWRLKNGPTLVHVFSHYSYAPSLGYPLIN